MRCRKVRSFLSTYCREETPAELSARIKEHLEDCSSCRREEAAYRLLNKAIADLSQKTASDDFTSRLFGRIGQERITERRMKAYFPKRIPRLGRSRLAAAASVAVIILALGIGFGLDDAFLGPNGRQIAGTTPVTVVDDDRYLTAQPEDNPLLNEHKSVSKMIAQYNRWREYSRSLRILNADQILGSRSVSFASSGLNNGGSPNIMIRPVNRDYLTSPE
jgi:hypothetical protein